MNTEIQEIEPLKNVLPSPLSKDVIITKPKYERRSEEVHEILSKNPSAIIRYGLYIITLIGFLVVFAAWYIQYPEIVKSSVMITTDKPPIKVIPRVSGKLQKILIKPNQMVRGGDFLAEIENTTRLENIPILEVVLKQLKTYLRSSSLKVTFPPDTLTFGDLQTEYNSLLKNYVDAERLRGDQIYAERKKTIQNQIINYQKIIKSNERQIEVNIEEFKNAEYKYLIDKKLYQDRVYSKLEFLGFENTFLQKKKEKEDYFKMLLDNRMILSEKQKQLLELDFEYIEKTRVFKDNILQSIRNIDNLLISWKQEYVITSPATGTVNFLKNITENQFVHMGDTLFVVLPPKQPFIAVATVSAINFGKVKVGQKGIIKLINYPFEEYGSLIGTIKEIESTASGRQYRIKMSLINGLETNYKRVLPFKNEMQGSLEIITEDMSLLERFFYGFLKVING